MKVLKIYANWDDDAKVWYVHKSDIPGLHAEAESQEELTAIIHELVPELITHNLLSRRRNRAAHTEVPLELISRKQELIAVGC